MFEGGGGHEMLMDAYLGEGGIFEMLMLAFLKPLIQNQSLKMIKATSIVKNYKDTFLS